ncbi:hypothetical protein Vadar_013501 [Vaccinium darrowii]|uniref:Uncharacterized protein n=1 Tax=Vaccinium darrowii TaxID=229202 RepID=A0ACB7YV73_9ERIC|nr:hypothetical protein Vadar_013501 [Vaccinium darrowii]
MSGRRERRGSKASSEDEMIINDLILKLQAILPDQSHSSCTTTRVPASKVLKEACKYIKRLHREADDLSERLSQLLASMDATNGIDADILRSLLKQ